MKLKKPSSISSVLPTLTPDILHTDIQCSFALKLEPSLTFAQTT